MQNINVTIGQAAEMVSEPNHRPCEHAVRKMHGRLEAFELRIRNAIVAALFVEFRFQRFNLRLEFLDRDVLRKFARHD